MARNDSGDFEDVKVNDNAMSTLAIALASAAATERDHRQRKILVENMVRLLFDVVGSNDSAVSQSKAEQSDHLVQEILGEETETGSTTIANSFSITTPVTKIIMNQNNSLKVHWSWQTSQDSDGGTDYSTCYLSVFAKEGATIDFYAPPDDEPQTQEETLKIAVCEVSNFQWTLEGTTKKGSNGEKSLQDIQSFWKVQSASFSWISGYLGDIPAEEVLLEGRDISLTGKIVDSKDNHDSLRLQSKSMLSIKISSVGSLGLSDKEIRRVGMSLKALVNFLDRIVSVPDLHLSLSDLSNNTAKLPDGNTEDEAIPPFGEDGDSISLGGAMRYYLKHYCNGSNQKKATNFIQSSKFLPTVDFASLRHTVTAAAQRKNGGSNYLAESKEHYVAAAGEAAGAATTAGKKIADRGGALVGSFWSSVGSLGRKQEQEEEREDTTSTDVQPTANANTVGFRFGDNFRKVVARGKEATDRVVAKGLKASGYEEQQNADSGAETAVDMSNGGYRFGETLRNAVANGKEATGRMIAKRNEQSEGLRFGGFSSGMFASIQGKNSESSAPREQEQPQYQQET